VSAFAKTAAVFLGFAAAAIALTWPLASHLGDAIPGDGAGDNIACLWNFWWMRHALATPDAFLHTNHLFYPFGADLVLHTHTALNAFIGATVLGRFTVVEAQNIVLLTSYALNGVAAYCLAWKITRDCQASVVAGVLFMSSPFFAAHLHGHFNLTSAWFVPLYAAAILTVLERRTPLAIVSAAALLTAAIYSDYYFVVFLILLTLLIVVMRWQTIHLRLDRPIHRLSGIDWALIAAAAVTLAGATLISASGGGVIAVGLVRISLTSGHNLRVVFWTLVIIVAWRRWRPSFGSRWTADVSPRRDLALVAAVVGVMLVASMPLLSAALQQWLRGDYVTQSYTWRSAPSGVDVVSLVAGNPFHPIWGAVVQHLYGAFQIDLVESGAWLGIVPIAALYFARRLPIDWTLRLWLAVAAVFFIWALGPYLLVAGVPTGLWLPELIVRYVPIAANARIPGRAMVIVYLALAVISAIVVSRLRGDRAPWFAAVVCVVAGIDFLAAPLPIYQLKPLALYDEIASAASGAVLELPLGLRDGFGETGTFDHEALFYQTIHAKPIAGGFIARLPPSVKQRYDSEPVFRALLALSSRQPSDAAVRLPERSEIREFLITQQFAFVVVNTALAPAALQRFVRQEMPLELRKTESGRQLYVVR
jgi:hypothetical protein